MVSEIMLSLIGDANRGERIRQFSSDSFGKKETFLGQYDLDQDAADALRALRPDLQQRVMRRGKLSGKDLSGVLMARVKQAALAAAAPQDDGHFWTSSVEKFLAEQSEEVDEGAADALRELSRELQQQVMELDGTQTARRTNPRLS